MWIICRFLDLLKQTPKIIFFLHVVYGINQSRRLKCLRNNLVKTNQTCKFVFLSVKIIFLSYELNFLKLFCEFPKEIIKKSPRKFEHETFEINIMPMVVCY